MLDQPPPNRLRIVEKGGRLVVIDRLTGATPPTAAERMKDWDAQAASRSPPKTSTIEPVPKAPLPPNRANPAPAASPWADVQPKAGPQNQASAGLGLTHLAQPKRPDIASAVLRASPEGSAKKRSGLPFALLILFILIAAWDVLNGFVIAILIFVGAAVLMTGAGSLTKALSQQLKDGPK